MKRGPNHARLEAALRPYGFAPDVQSAAVIARYGEVSLFVSHANGWALTANDAGGELYADTDLARGLTEVGIHALVVATLAVFDGRMPPTDVGWRFGRDALLALIARGVPQSLAFAVAAEQG